MIEAPSNHPPTRSRRMGTHRVFQWLANRLEMLVADVEQLKLLERAIK